MLIYIRSLAGAVAKPYFFPSSRTGSFVVVEMRVTCYAHSIVPAEEEKEINMVSRVIVSWQAACVHACRMYCCCARGAAGTRAPGTGDVYVHTGTDMARGEEGISIR